MRKKLILYSLIIILMAGLTGGCATTPEQPPYWPGEDWRTSTPEEQGLDQKYPEWPESFKARGIIYKELGERDKAVSDLKMIAFS